VEEVKDQGPSDVEIRMFAIDQANRQPQHSNSALIGAAQQIYSFVVGVAQEPKKPINFTAEVPA
jgi:hypothetical protein